MLQSSAGAVEGQPEMTTLDLGAASGDGQLASPPQPPLFLARLQALGLFACGLAAWGGSLKQIPPLTLSPVNFTLFATGLALTIGTVFAILSRQLGARGPLTATIVFFAHAVAGTVTYVASDYAIDKTARLFLVTLPAIIAVAFLVRDHLDADRLIRALLGLAMVLSLWIAFGGVREYGDERGRLTTQEGGTIVFGQAAGVVMVAIIAWLLTSKRITPLKITVVVALVGFETWTILSIASRGPIQAVVVAALAMVALQLRRFSPGGLIRVLSLFIGGIVSIGLLWTWVPGRSKDRILLLGSGRSASVRQEAWSYTWKNLDAAPFGNGWGSWETDSPIPVVYPHNLFLESWYETGVIGLLMVAVLVLLAFRTQWRIFPHDRGRATLIFGLVVFWIVAAQVSSDVNGNKLLFVILVAAAAPLAGRSASIKSGDHRPDLVPSPEH